MSSRKNESGRPENAAPRFARRNFLKTSTVAAAAGASLLAAAPAAAQDRAQAPPTDTGGRGRRYVIRGGAVMSMDPKVGDFEVADVLVEGKNIAAVGRKVNAPGADVIDARGRIVMPGFVDTHHHLFETAERAFLANGLLLDDGSGSPSAFPNYGQHILQGFARVYRPQDVYINELFAGLSQLDAGVTTVLDVSQIHHSPEHTDAAIQALIDTGRRAAFGFFEGDGRAGARYPEDARRIRDRWFSSDDQLVSMVMGGELHLGREVYTRSWAIARELDVKIAAHSVGSWGMRPVFDDVAEGIGGVQVGPDNLFIHMTGMSDQTWKRFRDAGAQVSLAVPIEMVMRHGTPPILKMQELGMEPSLSSDVETTMAADPFTLMRSAMSMQRMVVNQMVLDQGEGVPPTNWPTPAKGTPELLNVRDVLRYGTIVGAEHLGLGGRTGTLTPGKQADIVLLDATALNVAPLNSVPGAVVSLMDRTNVETVIVAGEVRKWRGRLLNVDLSRLRRELEASRDHLFKAAGIRRDLFAYS
ncbi:amidohydrolase family protein [Spongiactinospora sp. TRM90649]|uniref:amidohydrolase family protein n=1 Tax=Spongiactinospora sp. TRM90649 TaxID=3031114 RepID=UPI0023F7BED1|nr:amidohydrolase family protein [Spongiactinospora sp. TRM90649]MDF5751489.1 amidohydrolase family protein [Spongiactinospora sp. TRM90649]